MWLLHLFPERLVRLGLPGQRMRLVLRGQRMRQVLPAHLEVAPLADRLGRPALRAVERVRPVAPAVLADSVAQLREAD